MNTRMEENRVIPSAVSVPSAEEEQEIDLVEIGYLLLQHLTEIVACLIGGALVAVLFTRFMIAPKYTSTARMYVVSGGANSVVDLTSLQIGKSLTGDYTELAKEISISNPSDTRILDITVTDTDPQLAADIANTLSTKAKQYIPRVMNTETPNVFEEGIVPTKKSSPSTTKNGLLGGLLLSVCYMGFLIVKHITNDSFVTPEDVQKAFGVQPLAAIPESKKTKKSKKGGKK